MAHAGGRRNALTIWQLVHLGHELDDIAAIISIVAAQLNRGYVDDELLEAARRQIRTCYDRLNRIHGKRPARNNYRPRLNHRGTLYKQPQAYRDMRPLYVPPIRALRQPAHRNMKAAFRSMAAAFAYRARPEKAEADPRPVRPWRYNPQMSAAEIIAWAFKNGRLDILVLYGIFLPADFFEL